MLVHVDFAVALQLFCLVQGLTTGVYLLVARPRRREHLWLGLLLLGLTCQVADYFLSRSGIYYRHRWLYFTPLFFSWSFGPLLYGYVRARGGQRGPTWQHFVPGTLQLLFYIAVAAQDFDTKTWFWLQVHKPVTRYVEHYGAIASMLAYAGLAGRHWRGQGRRPVWLGQLLAGLALFYLAAALDPLLNTAYLPVGAPKFYLTSLVLPVLAYGLALLGWLGRRAVASPGLPPAPAETAAPPEARAAEMAATPAPTGKATTPTLLLPPPDPAQLARLVRALAEEQLFKDPDLTLGGLARHLGLTSNAVSQLVNAGLGQSFTDWVNGYRLAEVERRLRTDDARRFTVLALAFDAGFNSKTTFNRVFKEKTGLTPSAYQKGSQSTFRDDTAPVPG